ncbi:hypothetical protein HPHPA9_0544 [Helicobacter pylori Hp A-9]|uniref:Uncharacterized protein n=1 Tax=Helicobacter pylori Hp A-9 TaxID=992034 RepID=I9RJ40_HELPX|nr:hypothetical protein HPHPA9_0544 [Helicobacter pylori Hp A-9]
MVSDWKKKGREYKGREKRQRALALPKTNALKPLAFSYGDTRRNAFRRANME